MLYKSLCAVSIVAIIAIINGVDLSSSEVLEIVDRYLAEKEVAESV